MDWIASKFGDNPSGIGPTRTTFVLHQIALTHEIITDYQDDDSLILNNILRACSADPETCLDVVDAILGLQGASAFPNADDFLIASLRYGGSAWDVAPDGESLVRRIDPSATKSFAMATSPTDEASAELKIAWAAVFGRDPNPSDAWDHAIKACEHILKPIVTPNNHSATLGGVVGQLRANPPVVDLVLRDNGLKNVVNPLDAFEKILHLIWVNPDRHGGSADERQPSQQEAEAVVQLAVLVVQWGRNGILVKK